MPRFLYWILILAGAAAVVVLSVFGTMLFSKRNDIMNRTAQQQKSGETLSAFDQQVRQAGILACARTFSALGRGLSGNFLYAAQSQWSSNSANDHSIQSLVALKAQAGAPNQQPDAGIVFAAPVGGSCEGQLLRVTPVTGTCDSIAARLSKSGGIAHPFGGLSLVTVPDSAQVMLIPFSDSCVTVTVLRAEG